VFVEPAARTGPVHAGKPSQSAHLSAQCRPSFFSSSPQLTSWWLLLHLVIGGVGIMMLARALGARSPAATLVAGIAWCLSGTCTGEFTAGLRLIAGAYLPWCGLGFIHLARVARTRSPVSARLKALALPPPIPVALALLTGEVFLAIMAVGFALVVAWADVDRGVGERDGRTRRATQFVLSAMLSLVLAAGIAAVVIVPVQRIAHGNARADRLARTAAEVGSFHPMRLLELVAPGSMGDPYTDYVAGPWVGEKDLDQRPLIYGCYLGASAIVLAGFAFGRRRRGPLILAFSPCLPFCWRWAGIRRCTPSFAL